MSTSTDILSELYIHLQELVLLPCQGIREDSSFQTEFFLVHVEMMTQLRTHDPFFISTLTFRYLEMARYPAPVSRNSKKKRLAVGCRLLLLAENQRHRRSAHLLLAPA